MKCRSEWTKPNIISREVKPTSSRPLRRPPPTDPQVRVQVTLVAPLRPVHANHQSAQAKTIRMIWIWRSASDKMRFASTATIIILTSPVTQSIRAAAHKQQRTPGKSSTYIQARMAICPTQRLMLVVVTSRWYSTRISQRLPTSTKSIYRPSFNSRCWWSPTTRIRKAQSLWRAATPPECSIMSTIKVNAKPKTFSKSLFHNGFI